MSDVRNCKLEYQCHQRWNQLETVPGALRLRFCNRCQSAVHRADSEEEFERLARQGKCVAVFYDSGESILGVPCRPSQNPDEESLE
jgi:hypothetical protein